MKTLYIPNRHTQKDGTMCFWNLVTMGPRRQWQQFCETKLRRRGCPGSGGDEPALHQQVTTKIKIKFFMKIIHLIIPYYITL